MRRALRRNRPIGGAETPGFASWIAVLGLLGGALIDAVLLPLRLAVFLLRRRAIRAGIERLLTGGARGTEAARRD